MQSLPGVNIGGGLPTGFEPSGIVWHSRLQHLFLVSDGGQVSRMTSSGTGIANWNVSGDLEGITVADPSSDFVYLGLEHPDSILEFNFVTGEVTRTFDLTSWMTGPSNQGLEALTFVPIANNSEGGLFYAGHQGDGKIYTFQLPIKSSASSTTVTHVSTITPVPGRTDLSGLHYDVANGVLYAIFDGDNKLRAMTRTGALFQEWDLAGNDQEGITFAGTDLFIAEDVGKEVWRYPAFPFIYYGPVGDFDRTGVVNAADYTIWRDHLGASPGILPNDPAGGVIGQAQYAEWRSNFGVESGSGSEVAAIPEPTSVALLISCLLMMRAVYYPHPVTKCAPRAGRVVNHVGSIPVCAR